MSAGENLDKRVPVYYCKVQVPKRYVIRGCQGIWFKVQMSKRTGKRVAWSALCVRVIRAVVKMCCGRENFEKRVLPECFLECLGNF